jgi:hypothetical protein
MNFPQKTGANEDIGSGQTRRWRECRREVAVVGCNKHGLGRGWGRVVPMR